MSGYKLRLILYTNIETYREIEVSDNITFKQLHGLIQKLFNFDDYHMWKFEVPKTLPDGETVDLNNPIKTIEYDGAVDDEICEIFEENEVLLYTYDFGDDWEIIVYNLEKTDYNNKTALIVDYVGKYSPMDDIGGIMVFEEIMESIDEPDELEYVLSEYGLTKADLSKMDFEKKYKKGSRIRI